MPAPVEPELGEIEGFRSGTVTLLGRPNVGKSTLLNRLLGHKIAAVTPKPQTTRQNMLGVLHPPGAQLVLLDTPGHHKAKGPLNRFMVEQAEEGLAEADVVAYLVEARADGKITPGNQRLVALLTAQEQPVVLLLNKIDRVKDKQGLLLQLEAYRVALGDCLKAAVPISATRDKGLEAAVIALAKALPEGPAYYMTDTVTDRSEKTIAAELIREQLMLQTAEELPYQTAVSIDLFEDHRPRLVRLMATLHVGRAGQKPIVIGKQARRLREIGSRARVELERFLGAKVFLELHVRVTENWPEDSRRLAELGYGRSVE